MGPQELRSALEIQVKRPHSTSRSFHAPSLLWRCGFLKGKGMQVNFITQRVMRVFNKDGSHILCNYVGKELGRNLRIKLHVCTTIILMWKGKSLTMSRKNILGCSRERETEQDEAGSVWEPGPISTYLHLNPCLMANFRVLLDLWCHKITYQQKHKRNISYSYVA